MARSIFIIESLEQGTLTKFAEANHAVIHDSKDAAPDPGELNIYYLPGIEAHLATAQGRKAREQKREEGQSLLAEMLPAHASEPGGGNVLTTRTCEVWAIDMEKLESVGLVNRGGTGVQNIDLKAATKLGVVVSNAAEENAFVTAEAGFVTAVAMYRGMMQGVQDVIQGVIKHPNAYYNDTIADKNLTVVGPGAIGKEVAHLALNPRNPMRVTFFYGWGGMRFAEKQKGLDAWVEQQGLTWAREQGRIKLTNNLEEALNEADIVSLHIPHNAENDDICGREWYGKMPKGVVVSNVGRPGLMSVEDTIAAVQSGHVRTVHIDGDREGGKAASIKLFIEAGAHKVPGIFLTPHIADRAKQGDANIAKAVLTEAKAFTDRGDVYNVKNEWPDTPRRPGGIKNMGYTQVSQLQLGEVESAQVVAASTPGRHMVDGAAAFLDALTGERQREVLELFRAGQPNEALTALVAINQQRATA